MRGAGVDPRPLSQIQNKFDRKQAVTLISVRVNRLRPAFPSNARYILLASCSNVTKILSFRMQGNLNDLLRPHLYIGDCRTEQEKFDDIFS